MITKETVLQRLIIKIDDELDGNNYRSVEILANAYRSLEGDK